MRGLLVAGVMVLSFALTGCVEGDSTTAESPTPTRTLPSPTPTPTSTPTAAPDVPTGPPALDELVLTTHGFDQLALSSAPGLSPLLRLDLLECGLEEPVEAWTAIYVEPAGQADVPFYVAIAQDGLVAAIQVFSPSISTPQGIRTGSTREDLLAAYPGIGVAASDYRQDIYAIEAQDGRLEFSVAHAREGASWDPESFETVVGIIAARLEYGVHLPGFHPIGTSCL